MNKRLDRPGQKRIVRIYHLVAHDTVDATVVPILRGKDNAQDTVKRYIRDLRSTWK
jgi:SNF2 family DNA or RNA helicase